MKAWEALAWLIVILATACLALPFFILRLWELRSKPS